MSWKNKVQADSTAGKPMTRDGAPAKIEHRCTDTTNGEYVVHGLKIDKTWVACIYFRRAADDVHELAMTCSGHNFRLRDLQMHLKRTGNRWEYDRQQKRDAKKAAETAALKARKRVREAAPDLLAALKLFLANRPGATAPQMTAAYEAAQAAIEKAGEWPTEPIRRHLQPQSARKS